MGEIKTTSRIKTGVASHNAYNSYAPNYEIVEADGMEYLVIVSAYGGDKSRPIAIANLTLEKEQLKYYQRLNKEPMESKISDSVWNQKNI